MSSIEVTRSREDTDTVAAATTGDQSAFSELTERYRPELRVHCYRMLGSLEDSEDLTQETFLRAWHKRASFQGRSTFRAWLYRIATNACLDALERRPRPGPQAQPAGQAAALEIPWLQPYPDRLLEEMATTDPEPEAAIVAKETIELAFLVAIQHLPPRQRAVLILRDVLDWSAKDAAAVLDGSVASVNSALQRARAALKKHLPERRLEWPPGSDASQEERVLLRRYVAAHEGGDADAFVELMREDARFSMPPESGLYVGREKIVAAWKEGGFGTDELRDFRCLFTRANMQPALACYHRRPGALEYKPLALDVLRIEDGLVAEIVAFPGTLFRAFDLPPRL
jgi:RNA polymerase sigma-70 factor, ECF subfamily